MGKLTSFYATREINRARKGLVGGGKPEQKTIEHARDSFAFVKRYNLKNFNHMKIRYFYLAICGAIVVLILYINRADIQNNITDYFVWKKITREIKTLQIDKIEFPSNICIYESMDERLFLNHLLKSNYFKSNWKKEGPTGLSITVRFTCKKCITIQYWGKNIFEVMTSCKRQFLIKSKTLTETLRNQGITL